MFVLHTLVQLESAGNDLKADIVSTIVALVSSIKKTFSKYLTALTYIYFY